MKRMIVASVVGALLAVGGVAAPATAGSGSVTDSDTEGRSVRMTVTTPKYVTINRAGYTKVPVTAKLAFSGPGTFTGWWGDAGYATAESINGDWQFSWADFTDTVETTKKTTVVFRKYDRLAPQRLAVGAETAPVYGGSLLYPFDDHLTTVYLRNARKVVGTDAYRKSGSRAYVQVRGTVKENVWKSSTSYEGTWRARKGVEVAIQFKPDGAASWSTVKYVTTGTGGEVVTRIRKGKAGTVRIVVAPTNRTTAATGTDGVGAR
ncbi:hypothetical protein [Isoptericola sediminis]|uniref:Uncharacterized protein n=1 Tax=Isoptericola sediminis TaxID=2733572 RepID=A0A849JSQ3_9MICO|nr:hypothetical protein [Isoptericola sediminis]NNU26446.1 hypothetical protein [Isoptericola sediminis]